MELQDAMLASNRMGLDFLHAELSLAHTFLDSADISQEIARKLQSREDAVAAYQSVLKFLPRVRFTSEEKLDFDEQLEILRLRLVSAGLAE